MPEGSISARLGFHGPFHGNTLNGDVNAESSPCVESSATLHFSGLWVSPEKRGTAAFEVIHHHYHYLRFETHALPSKENHIK